MTIPRDGQTVHLLTRWDVLRVVLDLHRKEGRNVHELRLYAIDDLRRRMNPDCLRGSRPPIPDGGIEATRAELAELRRRMTRRAA